MGIGLLSPLLESLFEARLGNLQQRSDTIIAELEKARSEFYVLCNDLHKLDVEPYTEDLWYPNPSSIRSKKAMYATAIRQMMGSAVLAPDMKLNPYDRYNAVLSNLDSAINDILKANATYKIVLYCYSNHLKSFKVTFSAIERLRDSLRRELDMRGGEASKHNSLKEAISRLGSSIAEIRDLEASAMALKDGLDGKAGSADADKAALEKDLEQRKSGLLEINRGAAELSDRISLLTLPLGRTSRKLDHISIRKSRLSAFIADPIGSIGNEAEYKEFVALVQELKDAIETGAIESKNSAEILNSISVLRGSDIYGMINQLKSMGQRRSETEMGIMSLETAILDLKKGKAASENMLQDMSAIEERQKKSILERDAAKAEVERLFSAYYKKSISIML